MVESGRGGAGPQFVWTGPGSMDAGLRGILDGRQPTVDLFRVMNLCGEMAVHGGGNFGVTNMGDVLRVLPLATVLDTIQSEPTFDLFRTFCIDEWRILPSSESTRIRVPFDIMSEPSAAALLQRCGWTASKLNTQKGRRTPDLLAHRAPAEIEVEVVASKEKRDAEDRQSSALGQLDKITRRDDATVVVHVVDELSDAEAARVASAASELPLLQRTEDVGRWAVTTVHAEEQDSAPPSWWPKQYFNPLVTSVHLAGAPRRVTMRWGLSYDAYRNSVLQKIERTQFSKNVPGLVAWDTAELQGGVAWIADHGADLFGPNDDVSGVLAFSLGALPSGVVRWRYRVIDNPGAARPLPGSVLGLRAGEVDVKMFTF